MMRTKLLHFGTDAVSGRRLHGSRSLEDFDGSEPREDSHGAMTLEEVEAEITRLKAIWGRTEPYRFDRETRYDAWPHIEGDREPFQFVVNERGTENERREITAQALVFWALWTSAKAIGFGLTRKAAPKIDARATAFDGALRLMEAIGDPWHAMAVTDHRRLMLLAPISDFERSKALRLDLSKYGLEP